jgi:hypothetical protein
MTAQTTLRNLSIPALTLAPVAAGEPRSTTRSHRKMASTSRSPQRTCSYTTRPKKPTATAANSAKAGPPGGAKFRKPARDCASRASP